jgi:hypothetical protein
MVRAAPRGLRDLRRRLHLRTRHDRTAGDHRHEPDHQHERRVRDQRRDHRGPHLFSAPGPPPDLPHDESTTSTTTSDESTSSSTSGSTSGDTSTGDGESSSSTAPVESDSDTENAGLPPCDPNDDSLLACYDFENGMISPSMLVDNSGYQHDGMTNGGTYPAGYEGLGLKIAANTKAEVPDVETLNPQVLSISAWIKITALPPPGGAAIVEKSGQYALKIRENPYGLSCTVNAVTVTHNVSFPQDEWTHVACVHGNGQFKIYMNGQAVKVGVPSGNVTVGPSPLHVGCGGPTCQFRLIGAILDRVRLWKVAIPQNIVCAEANAC